MKRFPKLLIVSILVASTLSASNAQGGPPRVKKSPPGQLTIVTVNAQQFPILGMQRFRAMFQLTIALRRRPKAFDGGFYGAVQAPDVVVLQEIRNYNAEIFERILRQRFRVRYQIISPPDAAATLIVHPETVSLIGDVALITDRCAMAGDDRYPVRRYPLARFVENESDRAFSVVGVHFPKPSQNVAPECLERNIEQLRTVLEAEQTPTIIAGDFNRRPVQERYECDPDESSDPLPWYRDMTASDPATRDYVDTVRQFNRRNSISMEFEWTHEQKSQRTGCDGNPHLSRSRIDYIFAADAAVAEAHADHPGWAGVLPGSSHPKHYK